jgi:hypothetical protein
MRTIGVNEALTEAFVCNRRVSDNGVGEDSPQIPEVSRQNSLSSPAKNNKRAKNVHRTRQIPRIVSGAP